MNISQPWFSNILKPEKALGSASRIEKIGIVGEGKMGTGILNYLVGFKFGLVWVCSGEADPEKLTRQFTKRIKRLLDAGILEKRLYDKLLHTSITSDLTALKDCDLVIEAIPENLEMKKALFVKLDALVKQEAIFVSNSSSINPTEMVPAGTRNGKFAGLHFFYPVSLKNIVELTLSETVYKDTMVAIEVFLGQINRCFITLDEKNSFILNKIFLDFQNEAFLIVNSGHCNHLQMDQLVKKYLFPFGVFDFCDSVGLDTMLYAMRNYTKDYPHKSYYSELIETLSGLILQGKLGLKAKEGFYKYPLEEIMAGEPENAQGIIEHLRQTWLSSVKRFTANAHIPIEDANHAIREYFEIEKGPFE